MSNIQSFSFIVSLTLLTGCAASDDPMALVRGSVASSVADDGSLSAASLTLPFSGSYNGVSAAFTISQTGLGRAGVFQNTSSTNPRVALTAQTAGTSNALYVRSYGTGVAALIEKTNASSQSEVLRLKSDGPGTLLRAISTSGSAIVAENSGGSATAVFGMTSATVQSPALWAYTTGKGSAGFFNATNPNNSAPSLLIATEGTGPVFIADRESLTSGDIALFQNQAINQARIDGNGTGFFNGGTQTGGADVAEAFEVDGSVADYRPGDVLVISTRTNRHVGLSRESFSTRVIGVYATKPGVLLTERGIDDSLSDMIPVAVIGVIPTRVSAENGAIRRGDILVTAATPGHAMRTDPIEVQGIKLYPSGAILGKALEDFTGPGSGMIRVLVNVK